MKVRLSIWLMVVMAAGLVVYAFHTRSHVGKSEPAASSRERSTAPPSLLAPGSVKQTAQASMPNWIASQPELTSPVKLIVTEGADYYQREQAIQNLTSQWGEPDREAIYHFLRQHQNTDEGQPGQVLKNELLDALCRMQPPPAGLRQLLAEMSQDGSQNLVLRDYAVQHLTAFYQQITAATQMDAPTRQSELEQTRQILWQALNDTDSSMAGTALLGLSQLNAQGQPGIDAQKLAQAALKMAGDASAAELSRITALQVCATLQVAEALPLAWSSAQLANTQTERISAIAAIGALGGAAQEAFLNDLLQGKDERLKLPAQRALNQIQQRLQRAKSG